MKKLISFVMAAAMVASLVPATAFAAQEDVKATAKVVGVETTDGTKTNFSGAVINTVASEDVPELQLTVTDASYITGAAPVAEITVTLDNATFATDAGQKYENANVDLKPGCTIAAAATTVTATANADGDELTVTVTGVLAEDDIIAIPLNSVLDRANKNATVTVESDDITVSLVDDAYVISSDAGFTASVKKTVKVAEEEVVTLNDVVLKEAVDGSFVRYNAATGEGRVTLKLNNGFEFTATDDREFTYDITDPDVAAGKITLANLEIEATTAKAGATATITVTIPGMDKVTVDVAEVVDYKVVMSVDEDEDVPVIYSGVNVDNDGITDDSDHESLEITLEESFPGAWSMRQGFNITLPEGVYVTDVEVTNAENFMQTDNAGANQLNTPARQEKAWQLAFWDAYQDGDYEGFEFGKRVFDDVNANLQDDPASVSFILTLVADPGFEGDVEVGFEGALVDSQSVVAAKFVAPYTVVAEQNDVKIDSRYTSVDTPIVVKEAADGLWEKDDATFFFTIEGQVIRFEDTADFTADNEMALKDEGLNRNDQLAFTVKTESDKAATVTIDNMELFLNRSIPEGPYDLIVNTSMEGEVNAVDQTGYNGQVIFGAEFYTPVVGLDVPWPANWAAGVAWNANEDNYVGDVCDYDDVAKEAFINVITAPRDEDGFTTKISVPVGESYIIAGEKKVEIDTPAYINANGYTMLPLRAVAVALGVDNNSVIWDQSTRTATILYGNRIVSMQNGANVMYINAQAVPTKAGVEITNNRTFLSLRDLGTAMNVTDITWDAATRTAYLNAGVEA